MGVKKLALFTGVLCAGIGIESLRRGSYTFVFAVCLPALSMAVLLYFIARIGLPRCDERIKNLKRLSRLDPENAGILYDIGIAYALRDTDSGSRREAVSQLENFLSLFPDSVLRPDAEKALRMLGNKFIFFYYFTGRHGFRYSGEILKKGMF